MERRAIGKTPVAITPIMFGTSALGHMPDTYGYGVDEGRARATLDAIFAGPVNCLDTSNNYGFGRSEIRIGEAIRARGGLPEGFVISTKLDREMETGRFDSGQARRSIEQSLGRLGVDKVGLLHLHDPEHAASLDEITREGGALDELFKMKEEGIADAVGLAMGRVDMMFPILKERPFDALINHNRWTLLNRSADEMFDYASTRGIAILNAAPFAGGVLAKGADQMPKISYSPADETALAPVRQIEALAARHGVAPGAVALQFSTRDPRITATIVGVSRPDRVHEMLEWNDMSLPPELLEALASLPYSMDDPEAHRDYRPG
ncbi:MAG: aldo/keto reductase [Boseongicola sp. SB0677_bin_26]|nr:aldo/keto reductase [Boseongicola sp. SB0665_bin_10]MYG27252.1 aldo/keto reductase [Boseongicola sp. SB0677_bin_26]